MKIIQISSVVYPIDAKRRNMEFQESEVEHYGYPMFSKLVIKYYQDISTCQNFSYKAKLNRLYRTKFLKKYQNI